MSDLYLIAHKVRGAPAFDVAHQILCPECIQPDASNLGCVECDGLGYWWVIPTSGHRAYPYWHCDFIDLAVAQGNMEYYSVTAEVPEEMPPSLPDHYTTRAAPTISLIEALGLAKPKPPSAPIVRRF